MINKTITETWRPNWQNCIAVFRWSSVFINGSWHHKFNHRSKIGFGDHCSGLYIKCGLLHYYYSSNIGEITMDLIEEIVSDWSTQRSDIDCSGKEIVGRMLRFYSHYSTVDRALKKLKIAPNVFSVLVTIRRKGIDAEINVKDIIPGVLITSGAMSNVVLTYRNGLVLKIRS